MFRDSLRGSIGWSPVRKVHRSPWLPILISRPAGAAHPLQQQRRCHQLLLQDVIGSDSVQAKQWFLERRYNKLYSKNPNAHVDDETGEESKVDALEILAEKLRTLLDS